MVDYRPAYYLSTPMIKGELHALLGELVPEKRWPKNAKLKDFVEFTVHHFANDTEDPREKRALELAHVLHDGERK